MKRRSLEAAAGSNVLVAHNLWTMTAGDLRHAEDHMLLLGRKTAMEKVATFLLEMDRRLAKAGMMALPMCRRDIGDYLGLTLETVSRALSQLSDQGILVFSERPSNRAAQSPAAGRHGSLRVRFAPPRCEDGSGKMNNYRVSFYKDLCNSDWP